MILYCFSIELMEDFISENEGKPLFSEICKYRFLQYKEDLTDDPANEFKLYAKRGEYELGQRYKMTLTVE